MREGSQAKKGGDKVERGGGGEGWKWKGLYGTKFQFVSWIPGVFTFLGIDNVYPMKPLLKGTGKVLHVFNALYSIAPLLNCESKRIVIQQKESWLY